MLNYQRVSLLYLIGLVQSEEFRKAHHIATLKAPSLENEGTWVSDVDVPLNHPNQYQHNGHQENPENILPY